MMPLFVGGLEGFGDCPAIVQRFVEGQRPRGDALGERLSFDELENRARTPSASSGP